MKKLFVLVFALSGITAFAQVNQAKTFDGIPTLKTAADKVNAACVQVKNSATASRAKASEAQQLFVENCAAYVTELKKQLKNYKPETGLFKSIEAEIKSVASLQENSTK
ncbi:MAG: hypothetical protein ACXVC6_01495 [Bacteroidia bacterium]